MVLFRSLEVVKVAERRALWALEVDVAVIKNRVVVGERIAGVVEKSALHPPCCQEAPTFATTVHTDGE